MCGQKSKGVGVLPSAQDSSQVYLWGDFAELHEKITGETGSFQRNTDRIRAASQTDREIRIVVGVSRYNFFRIPKIIKCCLDLLGMPWEIRLPSLRLFPVEDLTEHFREYMACMQDAIRSYPIEIESCDDQLEEIIDKVARHARCNSGKEKDLLRLLGVITEQVFIGPQTIVFDPFHRCNSRCQHCWVHTPAVTQPEEFLNRKFDFERFKAIIDDASDMMVDGIILQGDGEPLMYEKFMPMLRYARNKNLGVLFFTNGILLDKAKAEEIIDLGVNEIYCSFPAGTARTYHEVCVTQPAETFYAIKENLKRLMRIRRRKERRHPRLIVSHVIHTMNYHELVEMAKMDVEIAPDAVRFYLIRLDVMNRFLQLKPEEVHAMRKMIPEITRLLRKHNIELVDNFEFQLNHYDEQTGAWSKGFFLNHGCTIGWYFNLIPAQYDMSFCCHLRTVGYLDKKSFKEVWYSPEYWQWRRQAKYLKSHRDAQFLNGQVLYDEHCDHCDNHQTIIRTLEELKLYDLYRYF